MSANGDKLLLLGGSNLVFVDLVEEEATSESKNFLGIGVRTGAHELTAVPRTVEFYADSTIADSDSSSPQYSDACFTQASGSVGSVLLLGADGGSLWMRPLGGDASNGITAVSEAVRLPS